MEIVSIIIPLYKGKKYIDAIIRQMEACKKHIADEIELIFVNDYPEDEISGCSSDLLKIIAIDTKINRGIHGARVEGLKHASGKYVWFLDQDDLIDERFLQMQIAIADEKGADAVVCGASREKKAIYKPGLSIEEIVEFKYMITNGNHIVSPGQVLVRRDKIPKMWVDNILKCNGADDWFLWICMLADNCKFVTNQEILYEHVDDGKNASANTFRMFQSVNEMVGVIKKRKILIPCYVDMLEQCVKKLQQEQIQILDKFKRMFFLYDEWMRLISEGKSVSSYLKKLQLYKVSIYGMGYIGRRLFNALSADSIDVVYCVDRDADSILFETHIYSALDAGKKVDLYIVTTLNGEEEKICKKINEETGVSAISFSSLLAKIDIG